jgi:hypothetical protein
MVVEVVMYLLSNPHQSVWALWIMGNSLLGTACIWIDLSDGIILSVRGISCVTVCKNLLIERALNWIWRALYLREAVSHIHISFRRHLCSELWAAPRLLLSRTEFTLGGYDILHFVHKILSIILLEVWVLKGRLVVVPFHVSLQYSSLFFRTMPAKCLLFPAKSSIFSPLFLSFSKIIFPREKLLKIISYRFLYYRKFELG